MILPAGWLFLGLLSLSSPSSIQVEPSLEASPPQESMDWRAAMAHVMPTPLETRWLDLPWQPTLRAGLVAGTQAQRPVILWAMNGHPLAST